MEKILYSVTSFRKYTDFPQPATIIRCLTLCGSERYVQNGSIFWLNFLSRGNIYGCGVINRYRLHHPSLRIRNTPRRVVYVQGAWPKVSGYQNSCNFQKTYSFLKTATNSAYFRRPIRKNGDRGGTVFKVLSYKSEGRWFDSRWCHWDFSLT